MNCSARLSETSTMITTLSPPQDQKDYLEQLLRRRRTSTSPGFAIKRKRLADNNVSLAKQALKAAIDGEVSAPPPFECEEELEKRKAQAFKEIKKLLDAQRKTKADDKRRLIEFLRGKNPRPLLRRQLSEETLQSMASSDDDDMGEDVPPQQQQRHSLPPSMWIRKREPRTPQQIKISQQAHRILKSINQEKRFTVIRQTGHQALAKHAARQALKTEMLHKQRHASKSPPEWDARMRIMKQAVKGALMRSHSDDDMARVARELLASAYRKSFKRQSAIQVQAIMRGYLVRKHKAETK
jgi:hypothetical protein